MLSENVIYAVFAIAFVWIIVITGVFYLLEIFLDLLDWIERQF